MSRPLRIEYSGALYHVTSRGNARQPIYCDEADFALFIDVFKLKGQALYVEENGSIDGKDTMPTRAMWFGSNKKVE